MEPTVKKNPKRVKQPPSANDTAASRGLRERASEILPVSNELSTHTAEQNETSIGEDTQNNNKYLYLIGGGIVVCMGAYLYYSRAVPNKPSLQKQPEYLVPEQKHSKPKETVKQVHGVAGRKF